VIFPGLAICGFTLFTVCEKKKTADIKTANNCTSKIQPLQKNFCITIIWQLRFLLRAGKWNKSSFSWNQQKKVRNKKNLFFLLRCCWSFNSFCFSRLKLLLKEISFWSVFVATRCVKTGFSSSYKYWKKTTKNYSVSALSKDWFHGNPKDSDNLSNKCFLFFCFFLKLF